MDTLTAFRDHGREDAVLISSFKQLAKIVARISGLRGVAVSQGLGVYCML
jgi:hypothetical protein